MHTHCHLRLSGKLAPLLFIVINYALSSRLGSLFADNLVLCETSREKVEQELENKIDQFQRLGRLFAEPKQTEGLIQHPKKIIKLGEVMPTGSITGVCLHQL